MNMSPLQWPQYLARFLLFLWVSQPTWPAIFLKTSNKARRVSACSDVPPTVHAAMVSGTCIICNISDSSPHSRFTVSSQSELRFPWQLVRMWVSFIRQSIFHLITWNSTLLISFSRPKKYKLKQNSPSQRPVDRTSFLYSLFSVLAC